jgi:hypothetical protein
MSRSLPPRPNLEHLKNQAKDRLLELQQRAPQSTLADALHAVAQEYGFKTWPELKAHVESLPAENAASAQPGAAASTPSAYESSMGRYNTAARRAMFFARYEAAELGSPSIESEHVFLGVLNGAEGVTSQLLSVAGVSLNDVRAEIATQAPGRETLPRTAIIPFHAGAIHVFVDAIEEANGLEHKEIDPAHLLLAIIRQEGSIAKAIMERNGMRLETTRRNVAELLKEGTL